MASMTRSQAAREFVTHVDVMRVLTSVGIHPSHEDGLYANMLREVIDHDHDTARQVVTCVHCVEASRKDSHAPSPTRDARDMGCN